MLNKWQKILALLTSAAMIVLPIPAIPETRGLVVPSPDTGEAVVEYRGSYALLIGASDYQDEAWPDLETIPGEIARIEAVLKQQGFVVEKHMDPTGEDLEEIFEDFLDEYGYDKANRLIFFYSGHGWTSDNKKRGFIVPVDAPDPRKKKREFRAKAMSMTRILAGARDSEANHALYLFDSCFSGTIFKTRGTSPTEPPHISRALGLPVRQFITAGGAEDEVPAASTFTPAFIDAIALGLGDLNEDGYVSGTELGMYLQETVPKYVPQTPQYGKIDDYELSRGDFIFALPRKQDAIATTTATPSAPAAPDDSEKMLDLEFWKTVRSSNDADMIGAYLETFPSGVYAKLAKLMLAKLEDKPTQELTSDDV
ncbi:MAG: caspase family protein [Arenicellales bacterium]